MLDILKILKERRKNKGYSQAMVGKKVGLPQSHISKIEQGKTDPRLSNVIEIARVMESELMLIPKELIPLIEVTLKGESTSQEPTWKPDEEESE